MALFHKKEGLDELLKALKKAQASKNYVKVANLYYKLAEYYYQQGNVEKRWLYINRFDNLSGSSDKIYGKIPAEWVDTASDWIGEIEEMEDFLPNELIAWAEEEAEELDMLQRAKWNLLTMARFEKLFSELAKLPDLSLLSQFGTIVDYLVQAVYGPIGEEYEQLLEFSKAFYALIDSKAFADVSNCIPIAGGADFEAYDLQNGETMLNMYLLMDDILQYAEQRRAMGEISMDLVTNVLQADYYIRTYDEPLREIPAVQAEVKRIQKDLEFVKGYPDKQEFMERMRQHRELMLPVH